jgi:hypothetical protein
MFISHTLRKRFIKDCKFPISLVQDPYFEYFLDLYEDYYGSKSAYTQFSELVYRLGGEEQFFVESKRITDSIIRDISETPEYIDFNTTDLSFFDVTGGVSQKNIYHKDHVGQAFASFDLVKANYNALKFIDPAIVLQSTSYEDLIGKYTDDAYFIESKHIRQVIFGNLNPKRQIKIEKYLIQKRVIPELLKFMPGLDRYVSASDDEVVVRLDLFETITTQFIQGIKKTAMGVPVRYTPYVLEQLADKPYFLKVLPYGEHPPVEFKAVPHNYFAECYRFHKKQEPTEYDKCTYHEGRVVKYLDNLFDEK